MKRMRNNDVIENFVGRFGDCQNHSTSLQAVNDKLWNYNTVIAQWVVGVGLVVNATKYSVTTSKLQNVVRRTAYRYVETTEHVPMGTSDLSNYVEVNEHA